MKIALSTAHATDFMFGFANQSENPVKFEKGVSLIGGRDVNKKRVYSSFVLFVKTRIEEFNTEQQKNRQIWAQEENARNPSRAVATNSPQAYNAFPNMGYDGLIIESIFEIWYEDATRASIGKFDEGFQTINTGQRDLLMQQFSDSGALGSADIYHICRWIYNVKRKLQGMKTHHEFALFLHGPQGSGKNVICEQLKECLPSKYSMEMDLGDLSDPFKRFWFGTTPVVVIDECKGYKIASIEAFKSTITAKTITYRRMRSDIEQSTRSVASFLMSANIRIDEVLKDSEMRRIYVVDTSHLPGGTMSYRVLTTLPWQELWDSIDSTDEAWFLAGLDSLVESQKAYVTKPPLEEWIEDANITQEYLIGRPVKWVRAEFVEWCEAVDNKFRTSNQIFGKNIMSKFSLCRKLDTIKIEGKETKVLVYRHDTDKDLQNVAKQKTKEALTKRAMAELTKANEEKIKSHYSDAANIPRDGMAGWVDFPVDEDGSGYARKQDFNNPFNPSQKFESVKEWYETTSRKEIERNNLGITSLEFWSDEFYGCRFLDSSNKPVAGSRLTRMVAEHIRGLITTNPNSEPQEILMSIIRGRDFLTIKKIAEVV